MPAPAWLDNHDTLPEHEAELMDETPATPPPAAVPPAAAPEPPGGAPVAPDAQARRRRGGRPPVRRRRTIRIRQGTLPGTLAFHEGTAPRARLTVMRYAPDRVSEGEARSVEAAVAGEGGGVVWINVDGLDPRVLAKLGAHFGLHPLALEDALSVPQRPKTERYEKHYFMVLRTMRAAPEQPASDIVEEQVSVFFGPGWIVTVQEHGDGDCFGPVREAIRQGRGRVREAGADYLAYLLLDAVVDAYFPVLEALDDRMNLLEEDAVLGHSRETLLHIQRLRHDLLSLRRAVWPVREQIGVLQRDDTALVAPETRVFLRDAYDHAMQALEIVEALRETSASVMEVHLSAQNQRLNEVMKVLTVMATLFIPLTFIASIYGMNFEFIPELHWRYGYLFALGLMAATAGAMILYFRRRGWW
jgi:magnesium transporter